jgi:uncharacterized protein (DUF58 family)
MPTSTETVSTTISGSGDERKMSLSSQPAGLLLDKLGLLVLLAGLVLAAWYSQTVIVVLLGLALSAAGLTKLWSRFSLVGVSCERLLSEQRVFPGEHIELRVQLINRKLLPLPWIQMDDEMPLKLSPDIPLAENDRPEFGFFSKSAALLWYTKVNWKERLCCHRRGYYQLGPITLTSGDIFGFYPRSTTQPLIDHVIVYPKIFPITHLGIPSLYPIGETTAERRLFQDPIRVIGVRDYTPRDSRRHIHWKATARRQELQVKVFEPTTTLKVAIFLAVDGFNTGHDEVGAEDNFELGISTAASIASYLTEHRSAVGLFANSCLADSGQPATLLPASGTGHLVQILEALAKVTPSSSRPFEEFLQAERTTLPWGTTIVFILRRSSGLLRELLVSLKESGYKLLVLQVGDTEESEPPGTIAWHRIRQPEDFMIVGAKENR